MSVKSEKTFEEIVERLSALFKLTPLAGEREYEITDEPDVVSGSDTPALIPESPLDSTEEK